MPEKAQDLYGTYGNVPTVDPKDTPTPNMQVKADPNDFGAQVGTALQGAGNQVEDYGQKQLQMATETNANDIIVNQYAPQAAQLRSQFDQLQGADKIAGYDTYIKGLQDLQSNTVANAGSPLARQIVSNWSVRHIANEIDGGRREADAAWVQHQAETNQGVQDLHTQDIATNNNDPARIDQNLDAVGGLAQLHGMNTGLSQPEIDQKILSVKGDAIYGAINQSNTEGNTPNTYKLLSTYAPYLDNDKRYAANAQTDNLAAMQSAKNNNDAVEQGQPLPTPFGYHAAETRAQVANAFQAAGLDPNLGLGHLRMESADGTNVGRIGNIGQNITVHKGSSLDDQIAGMVKDAKQAQNDATAALGRTPTAAENYVAYQQGSGGGKALLKAAQENPNESAVSALLPAYAGSKNPTNSVLQAIQNNGGKASMTAADFVASIEKTYWQKYNGAKITLPGQLPGIPANPLTTAINPGTVGSGDTSPVVLNTLRLNQPVAVGLQNDETLPQNNAQGPVQDNVANPTNSSVAAPSTAGSDTFLNQLTANAKPGDALISAYAATSPAKQASVDPQQQYVNNYQSWLDKMKRFDMLPEGPVREASIKEADRILASSKREYEGWKLTGGMDIMKLVADPDFTSMNDGRITPQMRSFLSSDSQMLIALQNAAINHTKKEAEISPVDPGVMATRAQLLNMQYNKPNDFINEDMSKYVGKLPSSEIVKNQDLQAKMSAKPDDYVPQQQMAAKVKENISDLLPTEWRKEKPDADIATKAETFNGRLLDEVNTMQQENKGKMPSRDDIRKVAVSLLGSEIAKGKDVEYGAHSSWGGNTTYKPYEIPVGTDMSKVHAYGNDNALYVPESFRRAYISQARAQGLDANENTILDAYTKSLKAQ